MKISYRLMEKKIIFVTFAPNNTYNHIKNNFLCQQLKLESTALDVLAV